MSESIEIVGARFVIEGLDTVEKGLASMGSSVDGAKRKLTQLGDGAGSAAGGLSAASAATAQLGKSADASTAKLDGAKRVLQGMGGPIGEIGGRVENLAQGFSKLGGPAGAAALAAVALAGTALAVVKVGTALVEATREARDYADELRAFSKIDGFGVLAEDAKAIEDANVALDSLDYATKSFKATLVSEFSPAIEAGAELVIKAELAMRELFDAVEEFVDASPNLAAAIEGGTMPLRAMAYALTGPVGVVGALAEWSSVLPELNSGVDVFSERIDHAQDIASQFGAVMFDMTKDAELWNMMGNVPRDFAAQLAKSEEEAAKAMAEKAEAATKQVMELARALGSDVVSAADAAGFAWLDAQDKLDELTEAGADAAMVEAARAEATKRYTRELTQIEIDAYAERQDAQEEYYSTWADNLAAQGEQINATMDAYAEAYVKDAEAQEEAEEAKREQIKKTIMESADAAGTLATSILGAYGDMQQDQIDQILASGETMADGQEKLSKAQRKELLKAFEAQQTAAEAAAVISAAQAALLTLASVPFPASAALVAALAVETGRQIAAIEKQEPPKLHSGYAPDEMPATLLRSEAVLNPAAVQRVGGPGAVDQLNRGGGGAGSVVRVDMMYGNRVLGRQWQDVSRMPGPVRDSLRSAATLSTGRHGSTVTTDPGTL